jgi:hypothetical protein
MKACVSGMSPGGRFSGPLLAPAPGPVEQVDGVLWAAAGWLALALAVVLVLDGLATGWLDEHPAHITAAVPTNSPKRFHKIGTA